MIKNSFILMLTGILINVSFPIASDASLGNPTGTHTHTNALELKPASLSYAYKTASVCFLGGNCGDDGKFNKGDDYGIDSANQCIQEGYSKLNCNSVQQTSGLCPYNSAYGKSCICLSNLVTCPAGQVGTGASCGGKYRSCQCSPSLVSCASNQIGSGAYCGGKYQSCTCKPEYQYNSTNCTSPRSLSGASCGGKYKGCFCPIGVSAGSYGCKEYYPSPCGSVCKVAYTDNCHNRTAVNTPYGCMNYFSDCLSKCQRAYSDNCRNRTAVTATYGCQTYFSDCASKCQKAYTDNCHNRRAVLTPYGCQQYWSDCPSKCQLGYIDNCHNRTAVSAPYGCQKSWNDCPSKCQTAYADNCRNRTDISVPANATCSQKFADCSSKCEAWTCNSGYNQSGNSCVAAGCPTGWIDQTALDKCMPKKYQPYKIYDGTYRCWEASICASHIKTVNGKVCYEYQPIARLASIWYEENTYCDDCNQYGTYCDLCATDEYYDASIGNGIINACSTYDK